MGHVLRLNNCSHGLIARTHMYGGQAPGLVQRMPNLEALDLWGCSHLSDASLREISEAPCVGRLEEVSLWGCSRVGDAGVRPLLERAPNLRKLNLGGTGIFVALDRFCYAHKWK